jgi:hypothetical protein
VGVYRLDPIDPNDPAATACVGATDAQTGRSILPSRIGAEAPVANAATKVAGRLITIPAAAATLGKVSSQIRGRCAARSSPGHRCGRVPHPS